MGNGLRPAFMNAGVCAAGALLHSPGEIPCIFKTFYIMGRSVKGGVFGFLRGKVGSVSYSIMKAKQSASGKKEQIVRVLPDSVDNPNTIGQVLQRMKIAPAQKFYAALSTLLSHSWQGVDYGEKSRQYFLAKAMKMQGGPYIPKGTDRFIPGEYPISEGSLAEAPLLPFQTGDDGALGSRMHFDLTIDAETDVTPVTFAAALGVPVDTQITLILISNDNGVFTPHYAGWNERIRISDIPAAAFIHDTYNGGGNVAISPAAVGGLGTIDNVVAMGVILSIQDASSVWLRSTQSLVLSYTLHDQLYSTDAMNAAISSYRDAAAANSIGSEYYLNLGVNQAFNGRVYAEHRGNPTYYPDWYNVDVVYGEYIAENINTPGTLRNYVKPFATSLAADGLVIILVNGVATTDATLTVQKYMTDFHITGDAANNFLLWNDAYATQAGF